MKIKFKDRFGRKVEFVKKEKVFRQLPGESFMTALVRTYYPNVYRRHQQMRDKQELKEVNPSGLRAGDDDEWKRRISNKTT